MKHLRPFLTRLWHDWLRPVAVALAIVLPAKSVFADWNYVPSGSMEPSIRPGELVWVNKLAYDLKIPFTTRLLAAWDAPARGDVVALFSPADDVRLVKRVVGLPGDTVEMRDTRVWINGTPLAYEPASHDALHAAEGPAVFASEQLGRRAHPVKFLPGRPGLRSFPPVRVPDGHYLVLGDNRDNSHDSRALGFVARNRIVGRVTTVIASVDLEHYGRPRFGRFLQTIP